MAGQRPTDKILGNVRVQGDSAKPVFVGIGADEDVDRFRHVGSP
jgi:hypothetical protein